MPVRTIVFLLMFISLLSADGRAQEEQRAGYAVSCTIEGSGGGLLHVFLITEDDMGSKNAGFRHLEIDRSTRRDDTWQVTVRFENIPAGEYGMRTYVDENNNGELDRRGFRPVEPWGFSWNKTPQRGVPRFNDISFHVPEQTGPVHITLQ